VALGITASAGGQELSQRLLKIEAAIVRQKTITFEYYTMERDELGSRRVDPYHLLYRGGQFYLLGYSHERKAIRVFRLTRIRGKVAYATKAEHDFKRPREFDPRSYADRAEWQFGDIVGVAEVRIAERIAWQVERHFGSFGEVRSADGGDLVFATEYASPRQLISWVLGLGEHARLLGPPELVEEMRRRVKLLRSRHAKRSRPSAPTDAELVETGAVTGDGASSNGASASEGRGNDDAKRDAVIRPERFARLVTLASILIEAGRAGQRLDLAELCERLQVSEQELREDVGVLNVVNFGGGSYVLYAEISDEDGTIEVDPEPYSDNFARPARLLPVEAKALVAAIDLLGEHVPEGSLASAREKIVAALGEDPLQQGLQVAGVGGDDSDVARTVSQAIARRRIVELDYYKENEDEFSLRRVEPYALINGREGWYLASFDPDRGDVRHFRLDRIKRAEVTSERYKPRPEVNPAADVEGWPRTGEVASSRSARVWISPERARWAAERRRVVERYADGSITVELSFAGVDWLVREVLKEAGDAVVIEPGDAREAVREAAKALA
jgi:proteasome accessory factor C